MQENIQESAEEFAEFERAALTISMRPDGTSVVQYGLPNRMAKRAEKHKARVQEELPDCAEYKMSNDLDDASGDSTPSPRVAACVVGSFR